MGFLARTGFLHTQLFSPAEDRSLGWSSRSSYPSACQGSGTDRWQFPVRHGEAICRKSGGRVECIR